MARVLPGLVSTLEVMVTRSRPSTTSKPIEISATAATAQIGVRRKLTDALRGVEVFSLVGGSDIGYKRATLDPNDPTRLG